MSMKDKISSPNEVRNTLLKDEKQNPSEPKAEVGIYKATCH